VLFNSEPYLVFLPAAVVLNWVLPARFRPVFLLAASYYFYAFWNPPFLLLIVALTVANYFIAMAQGRLQPRRRSLVLLAVGVDLGALVIFKYLGLLDESARNLAAIFHLPDIPAVHLILPLGLSFFTFEFIHYQVDVYRGDQPIRDPLRFALFPAFFPTQIAGPIKRYQNFDPQVGSHPRFDPALALEGIELIAVGLVKKVLIADSLVPIVDAVYGNATQGTMFDAWAGVLGFYLQLFFDFSGYTDIGRGSAQLLGYRVPLNFNLPFMATSFAEFWRRWHMSLSFWLRDYLYIPLGGNRMGPWRNRFNFLATMALAGLWHGAAWHFMLMGIAMGLGFGVGMNMNKASVVTGISRRLPAWALWGLAWGSTQLMFMFCVNLFRSPSVQVAAVQWWHMFTGVPHLHLVSSGQLIKVLLILLGTWGVQFALTRWDLRRAIENTSLSLALRPAYVASMGLLFTYGFAVESASSRFIYFQF
jgi:D-alanyl-lipoteichoic acid acyltransferase DltB (MBOAT superfamily)